MPSNSGFPARNSATNFADHRELDRLLRLAAKLQGSLRPQLIEPKPAASARAGRIAARRRIKPQRG
jgi:hypothetical protein